MSRTQVDVGKDSITDYREWHRQNAIRLVKNWTEHNMSDFKDPVRKGKKKGVAIGFSRTKIRAAHLMVLYPAAWRIKEIAQDCGTTQGVLNTWRIEKTFRNKTEELHKDLAKLIGMTLQNVFYCAQAGKDINKEFLALKSADNRLKDSVDYFNYWVGVLPFLSKSVIHSVISPIAKLVKTDKGMPIHTSFLFQLHEASSVRNTRDWRRWEKAHLELTKNAIAKAIDLLSEKPEEGDMDPEEFRKHLKGFIFNKLDILAF